jgi:tripartite-type tricarboxylate transporter receptor subunit TctC
MRLPGLVVLLALSWGVVAQDFPSKHVRLVVGFPPASTTDLIARALAPGLQSALKQQVLIDNRPGASATIAAAHVARSAADGYTLLLATLPTLSTALNTGTLSGEKPPYDPINDFSPVANLLSIQFILAAASDVPASNLTEFLALLRANPGKYSYGSSGTGSTIHLGAELFSRAAGAKVLHVPYKGTSQVVQDLLGQKISFGLIGMENLPSVRAGTLKAFAVSGTSRDPIVPELPTIAEAFPGFNVATSMVVLAPKGTPRAVIDTLNRAANHALGSEEFAKTTKGWGGVILPASTTPEAAGTLVREEIRRWDTILKASNIKDQ